MTQKPVLDYESKPGYPRAKSPDEPVLDYQSKAAVPRWRQRVGVYAMYAAGAMAAPNWLLLGGNAAARTVWGHGMALRDLNPWLEGGLVCNLMGVACAALALVCRSTLARYALLALNVLSLLFTGALPTF